MAKPAEGMLTVAELIEILKQQPPESLVWIHGRDLLKVLHFKHFRCGPGPWQPEMWGDNH